MTRPRGRNKKANNNRKKKAARKPATHTKKGEKYCDLVIRIPLVATQRMEIDEVEYHIANGLIEHPVNAAINYLAHMLPEELGLALDKAKAEQYPE